MEWTVFIGPGVSLALAGGGGYVTYLVFKVRTESKLDALSKDVRKEGERLDKRVERTEQEIALTNARITVAEKSVIELGAKAVTREDLKEVKVELVDRMDALGDRMDKTVDRLLAGFKPRSRTEE